MHNAELCKQKDAVLCRCVILTERNSPYLEWPRALAAALAVVPMKRLLIFSKHLQYAIGKPYNLNMPQLVLVNKP